MNSIIRAVRQSLCGPKPEVTSYLAAPSQYLASCKERRKKKKRKKDSCGSKNKHPVKGRVALITGGAVGIGYSMAKLLLACGARDFQGVFLGGRREEMGRKAVCKLSEEFGDNKVIFMKCDVSKGEDLKRAFKCTAEYFNGLDIVVNNAGILKDHLWKQTIQINCMGLFHGCLLGFKYMGKNKGHKGGVIVNNASIVGLQEFHGSPAYGSSKHFVIGVTRNFGHPFYYKQSKVKVMAICPGVTSTYMVHNAKNTGLKEFKGCGKETDRQLGSLPSQPSDACGCHLISMLEDGENGSIWVSEDSECYKVKLPSRLKLRFKTKKRKGGCKRRKKRRRCRKGKKKRRKGKKRNKCRKGKKGKKKRKKKGRKCGKGKKKRRKSSCGKKKRKSSCGKKKRKSSCGKKRKSCKQRCKKYNKKGKKKRKNRKNKCD